MEPKTPNSNTETKPARDPFRATPKLRPPGLGLRATAIHLVQQLSRQTDWTFRFTMLGPLQIAFVNIEETGLEQG
jgi:hypothetical protein